MCRMVASLGDASDKDIYSAFMRMAQGLNALDECNTSLGKFTHASGWGVVYVEDGKTKLYKSTKPCWEDHPDKPAPILVHARDATVGGISMENTHPFHINKDGKDWWFCHNGTINDKEFRGEGKVDSLAYFEYLLENIDEDDAVNSLKKAISRIKDYTSLNAFLLTEECLYVICWYSLEPRHYTLHVYGDIISSEPLPSLGDKWKPMENGSVALFRRKSL